mmetsp:Transcript_24216/g.43795  ORF Transcript_24216/g.43795 Transcript_24216/m.43795 type:complete len:530 (+) Transcript_24216:44-1633(+)|eukprot:CAMPEP_0196141018 /NCGR_PEP_ID=MMETSP0910-20130528/8403_1 /TAXON_ID=49265 /ORGANISM="Thalassiosira rotula, Strain GSO102" /LENGTH=529 /DNA_ID=CAMNT_0041402027 /DNA_START=31 /DNA_END=1620 /DNA_ORIENTATION=+
MAKVAIPPSPVAAAFRHIQWDPLSSLRLTPQETALLRMAETNPIEYTLGDARDATMYVRVLLKLLAEASFNVSGHVARISDECNENRALDALDADPLGVVTHYAIAKLHTILTTLCSPWAAENGVSIGNVFYAGMEGDLIEQWKSLLRVISKGKGDLYAQRTAALCLAQILLAACPSQRLSVSNSKDANALSSSSRVPSYASAIEPLEALTAWVISQLKSSNALTVGTTVPAVMALMGATEGRQIFAASGGIKYLSRQLRQRDKKPTSSPSSGGSSSERRANSSVQQLYELAFCLWCLTYELNNFADVRADFAKDGLAVMALVELVSSAPREKVVRVALAALKNLAVCSADVNPERDSVRIDSKVFLGEMIACGLLKAIGLLQERQFTDPDIVDDVESLHKLLADNFKEMTRWEVYQNEVETGQLQWGSTHTDAFFKENANMMEGKDGDFKLVKILISLIGSKDEDIAAIACFDLGEFCRHYPNGRAIAKRLGGKELAMTLIEHDNPELQRHALQCVSKIMVSNWEYVK